MVNKEIKQYIGVIMIVLCVYTVGYTAAFYNGGTNISGDTLVEVGIEESAFLHFDKSGDISIEASMENFKENGGNLASAVNSTVSIKGSEETPLKYTMTLVINENNFIYTTNSKEPELVLTILDKNGDEIKTLGDLKYVSVTNNGSTVTGFDVTQEMHRKFTILEDEEIMVEKGNSSHTDSYTITLTHINLDTIQDANAGKTFDASIEFSEEEYVNTNPLIAIYENYNTSYYDLVEEEKPDFGEAPGFEKTIHTIEDNYTNKSGLESVYFRGAVDNNWVYFGGFYWRILRVDGRGDIKMIYSGTTAPTASQSVVMTGTSTQIGTGYFNYSTTPLAQLVGYSYSSTETHGVITSSNVKTTIDSWYSLNFTNSTYTKYITDSIYCNDRTVFTESAGSNIGLDSNTIGYGATTTNYKYHAASIRILNNVTVSVQEPSIMCKYKDDAFTVEDNVYGNGALTYPIALITSDEAALAGVEHGPLTSLSHIFLYTGVQYWSMSPHSSTNLTQMLTITNTGTFAGGAVASSTASSIASLGIRPVITISGDTPLSGDGTYSDPFTLVS